MFFFIKLYDFKIVEFHTDFGETRLILLLFSVSFDGGGINLYSFPKFSSVDAIAKILSRFGIASTKSFVSFSKLDLWLRIGELKSEALEESSECGESGLESLRS